jgi:inosose dehydratase
MIEYLVAGTLITEGEHMAPKTTRRAALCAFAGLFARTANAAGGHRLQFGIHTYSLKHLSFEDSIRTIAALGVRNAETFDDVGGGVLHLPIAGGAGNIGRGVRIMRETGVRITSYGVIGFDGDAERSRRIFAFADALRIPVLSADPDYEAFGHLEKLVAEFDIAIAIHPHGRTHPRYPGWKAIREVIWGRHRLIGVCLDTRNSALGGDEAVEGIYALRNRIYDVHLKDISAAAEISVPLGTGDVNISGALDALARIDYRGPVILEFEREQEDPLPGIRRSVSFVRSRAKTDMRRR